MSFKTYVAKICFCRFKIMNPTPDKTPPVAVVILLLQVATCGLNGSTPQRPAQQTGQLQLCARPWQFRRRMRVLKAEIAVAQSEWSEIEVL